MLSWWITLRRPARISSLQSRESAGIHFGLQLFAERDNEPHAPDEPAGRGRRVSAYRRHDHRKLRAYYLGQETRGPDRAFERHGLAHALAFAHAAHLRDADHSGGRDGGR